jgi:Icc-related predicted phosphoesterase
MNGDNDIQITVIFQRNFHTNLNTCPTVSQAPGNLRRNILVVAVGITRSLLFQPRRRQESVAPKDVVLEVCLT